MGDSPDRGQPHADHPDDPLRGRAPWDVAMEALTRQALGEPTTDDEHDALGFAMTLLCAAPLVQAGVPLDTVLRQFDERDHTFHLKHDRDADDITIEVRWADGEVTTATSSGRRPDDG